MKFVKGQEVKVINKDSAWYGETGIVYNYLESNQSYLINLKGLGVAFFENELAEAMPLAL